jgi:hypothetical protein
MSHVLKITDITRVQTFEVKFDKSDSVGLLSEITKRLALLTYQIIILVFGSFTIYNDAS